MEIQLVKTDECHIFRTIEYWDLEKKRYPQYDHIAVLIAEDITSRFLNIISLLNGFIPLVAIQLNAIQIGDQIALIFTIVLDHRLGLGPDEEEEQEVADRAYWEKRSSKTNVDMADEVMRLLKPLDQELALKYTKFYISVARNINRLTLSSFDRKRLPCKLNRSSKRQRKAKSCLIRQDLMYWSMTQGFSDTVFASRETKSRSISVY